MTALLEAPTPPASDPAFDTEVSDTAAAEILAELTRRGLLIGGLGVGAALLGCGEDGPERAGAGGRSRFTYTGARGERVSLDALPERIVADVAMASALIPLGIRPVGVWSTAPLDESPALRGLDLTGIRTLGETFGDVDVERVAAVTADLMITGYYPLEKQLGGIEPGDEQTVQRLERIAPIVTVNATNAATRYIADVAALASRLGAEADAPYVVRARRAFEAAVRQFRRAVAANPGLTVTAVSTDEQNVFIANPPDFAEFLDLERWGLDIQSPEGVEDRGYFARVSWERVPEEVRGDLVFLDARSGAPSAAELDDQQPTWSRIPAVAAGNVTPWVTDTFTNYASYTRHLRGFTRAIERTDPRPVR